MKRIFAVLAVLLLAFTLSSSARADSVFIAHLDGTQETPPLPDVVATGLGTVTLNSAQDQITVNLSWQDLTGEAMMGHIHGPAPRGVPAPVLIPFWGMDAPKPPTGSFFGTFSVSSDIVGYLKSGLLYINIHTPNHPLGEIRGQLEPVPEPATMVLLGTGLAGIGVRLRKRRQTKD